MNQSNRGNDGEREAPLTWEDLLLRERLPMAFFNDDDIYLYCSYTLQLHKTISCNSVEGAEASRQGLRVRRMETWDKGLSAKYRGLWRFRSDINTKGNEMTQEILQQALIERCRKDAADRDCPYFARDTLNKAADMLAAIAQQEQTPPVIVAPDADSDAMNTLHGEAYGVNWVYPPIAQPEQPASERELTDEAQSERDDWEREADNCSCHISAPCGCCTHPGNPMNQDEDETAWKPAIAQPEQPATSAKPALGIKQGETTAQAAEGWEQWCEAQGNQMLANFLREAIAQPAMPPSGPGTAKWRLTMLMESLEQRFPHPKPLDSTKMPEAYALEAIDRLIAATPQPATSAKPAHILEALLTALRDRLGLPTVTAETVRPEPEAWAVYLVSGQVSQQKYVFFSRATAMDMAGEIKAETLIRPLYTTPQPAEGDAKDAELLDWLQSNPDKPPVYWTKRWACPGMTSYEYETFTTLREAICAAIASKKATK